MATSTPNRGFIQAGSDIILAAGGELIRASGDFLTRLTGLEKLLKLALGRHTQNELRILVTGKTGQGKSTLVNGVLGAKVAREGAGAERCTTKVKAYFKNIHGVPIEVYDSPGLQDGTKNEDEYIQEMRKTCQQLSLVLYCTKMTETRLKDEDKNAMIKLTRAFGEEFWNYAVFVLTFANKEDVERKDERDSDVDPEPVSDDEEGWKELEKRRFKGRLKKWENALKTFLVSKVGVNSKIAGNIPVVPTGDYRKSRRKNRRPLVLPDRSNWFNDFWEVCCLQVKDTGLFLQVNSSRMIPDDEICDDLTKKDHEDVHVHAHQLCESETLDGLPIDGPITTSPSQSPYPLPLTENIYQPIKKETVLPIAGNENLDQPIEEETAPPPIAAIDVVENLDQPIEQEPAANENLDQPIEQEPAANENLDQPIEEETAPPPIAENDIVEDLDDEPIEEELEDEPDNLYRSNIYITHSFVTRLVDRVLGEELAKALANMRTVARWFVNIIQRRNS